MNKILIAALVLGTGVMPQPATAGVTYSVDRTKLTAGATVPLSDVVSFHVTDDVPFAAAWFFPEDDRTTISGGGVYPAYDPSTRYSGSSYWFDLKGSYAAYNNSGIDFPAYSTGSITVPETGQVRLFVQTDWINAGGRSICCVNYSYITGSASPNLSQILGDSVHVESGSTDTFGGYVQGDFIPNLRLTLSQAASRVSQIIGTTVDHFNWVQTINSITIPLIGTDAIGSSNAAVSALARRPSGLDPLINGNPSFYRLLGYNTSDALPEYWDEYTPNAPNYNPDYLVTSNTHGGLTFYDEPSGLPPGTVLDFSTILVGVGLDGMPIYFNGIDGIGFHWRFTSGVGNTAECVDTSVLTCINFASGVALPNSIGTTEILNYLTASQYTQVENAITPPPTSSVPEPSTWLFMIFGFGFLGTKMRSRVFSSDNRARVRLGLDSPRPADCSLIRV
ncbi:MAG: PEPxxWA-CTERM sorting domain-containing protein [Sphingomonadales bacterium]|nr:PEPxxWA-CTERM sorting domain-containing protein [Sphingomonadales bacterium]